MPHNMMDIMVDLETLGNKPGCKIMSIGAVKFSEAGLGDEFYVVVHRYSQPGLVEDPETLKWWDGQSEDAKKILRDIEGPNAIMLRDALFQLNRFISKSGKDVRVWGNGADFDNAILACAFAAVCKSPAWKFWNNRCYRTLKNLFPKIELKRTGTHHNALDDAKSQARHAVELLDELPSQTYTIEYHELVKVLREAKCGEIVAALIEAKSDGEMGDITEEMHRSGYCTDDEDGEPEEQADKADA